MGGGWSGGGGEGRGGEGGGDDGGGGERDERTSQNPSVDTFPAITVYLQYWLLHCNEFVQGAPLSLPELGSVEGGGGEAQSPLVEICPVDKILYSQYWLLHCSESVQVWPFALPELGIMGGKVSDGEGEKDGVRGGSLVALNGGNGNMPNGGKGGCGGEVVELAAWGGGGLGEAGESVGASKAGGSAADDPKGGNGKMPKGGKGGCGGGDGEMESVALLGRGLPRAAARGGTPPSSMLAGGSVGPREQQVETSELHGHRAAGQERVSRSRQSNFPTYAN